ncbi:MAG: hypothetical protein ABGZ17_23345 [Planctomycetaceae bacterium]
MFELMFTVVPILAFGVFVLVVVGFGFQIVASRKVFGTVHRVIDQALKEDTASKTETPTGARDYTCDHCGATLSDGTEVSPSGDFRCQYCDNWSNVHS